MFFCKSSIIELKHKNNTGHRGEKTFELNTDDN